MTCVFGEAQSVPDVCVYTVYVPNVCVYTVSVSDACVYTVCVPNGCVYTASVPDTSVYTVSVPDTSVYTVSVADACVYTVYVPDMCVYTVSVSDVSVQIVDVEPAVQMFPSNPKASLATSVLFTFICCFACSIPAIVLSKQVRLTTHAALTRCGIRVLSNSSRLPVAVRMRRASGCSNHCYVTQLGDNTVFAAVIKLFGNIPSRNINSVDTAGR